ncbi:uncharacterized protein A1O5_08883 [Cladophialophora psammophila CBS 110553]|uniref:Wax synthase domain-containing protein n=1 Tax=Cladophialophora psammophila CBS 110553 TaxID=1182543 RepID=W9WK14_9EURO|nr:uncharacterized protein A1O5_08883 [Cladophialophora psammophila CBS 110553]EXJ68268.1 hypothetical protein A1O5_08883 [Cladophialophora psammophila CBS 110553]
MDPKWFPPPDRPFQPGERSVFGASAIGITTLLLPQGQFRKIIAIPPILWIIFNLRRHTTGKLEEDYMTAINVCMILIRWLDFEVLHKAEQTFRRVKSDGTTETAEDIQKMTIWQKFCWGLQLFATMRGIGWNWRVKNVGEVPRDISRSRFVLEQVARASYCFLYMDIDEWYMRRTPFGDGTSPVPDLFTVPLWQQILLGWSSAFHSGFTMVFGYYLAAAVAVGTGLYTPQSWPPFFGSFIKKGYSLRNIWGSCWHQLLRRMFESANSALLRLLRVKKGTLVSRYVQLYNAFLVSALIHHAGALNCPSSSFAWCQFYFFMIQPVAITFEDLAIYLGKKTGLKDTWKTRAVGYVWVVCFLSYSLRYAAKGILAAGLGGVRHPFVDTFSIIDRLFG